MPEWIKTINHAVGDGLTVGVVHIPNTVVLSAALSLIVISIFFILFLVLKHFGAFTIKSKKRIVFVGNDKDNVWVSKEMLEDHIKGFGRPGYDPESGCCKGTSSLSPDSKTKINLSKINVPK